MRYKLLITTVAVAASLAGASPAAATEDHGPNVGAIMAYLASEGYADEFARYLAAASTGKVNLQDISFLYPAFAADHGLRPLDDPSFS